MFALFILQSLCIFAYLTQPAHNEGLLSIVLLMVMICIVALQLVVFLIVIWANVRKPALPRETQAEKDALEKWLVSEGYRKFVGKEYIDDGVIVFKLGKERFPFALSEVAEIEHGNYFYKDYGSFRMVERLDGSTKAVYWK